jgi:hypothetical protein
VLTSRFLFEMQVMILDSREHMRCMCLIVCDNLADVIQRQCMWCVVLLLYAFAAALLKRLVSFSYRDML